MDYNDNDYQSKNLHLAGEDSSKVSSVLRPFALPRFDFDDSLQGHLRFDSLVENEVFLGIPCQEDNQWIEDFSRGSSGIEFSSSATESCSIPGRNNVWSEATSSESVEMLLKSVGQEHNLPVDAIVQESDGGNMLGNVTHETEPRLQEDDKIDCVEDPIIGVQADQFLDKFSRSSETTEGEIDHLKCTLQVAGTSSGNVANSVSAETTTDKSLQTERENSDLNQAEVNASHNETLVNQNGGDPCVSGIQVQIEDCSSYNDTIILGNPDVHDKINDIHQTTSGLPGDFGKGGEDNITVNKDISMDDKKLSGIAFQSDNLVSKDSISNVTSEAEDVKELGVRNTFTNLEESSTLLGNEECNFLTAEGCKKNAPSTGSPHVSKSHVVSSKVMESEHQPEGDSMQHEEQSVSFKSTCASEGHGKEVRETDDQGSNLELVEGLSTQTPYEQSSFTEQEHNTIEKSNLDSNAINESCIDHGDDLSNPRDASVPSEIHEETPVGEDLAGGNDEFMECEVGLGDGNHVSSHVLDEPEKPCREDVYSKQPINTCNNNQTASSVESGEMVSSVVASDVEPDKSLDNHMGAGSSLVEQCREHADSVHGSEFATSRVNKQASDTEVEDANRSSHDTVDSVPLSERSDTHMGSQLGPVSDVEKDTFVATPLTDHSITMMEASKQTDQANVAGEVHEDCSLVREIGGQQHDSVAEEGTNDEKVTIGKQTDNEGKKSSKAGEEENSEEQGALDLSSAVDGTATQCLQTERKKNEVGNKGAVQSLPPPQDTDDGGKVQSMCVSSAVDLSTKETHIDLQSFPCSTTDTKVVQENPQPIDKATPPCSTKGGSENKTRRRSGKSGRENSRKGKVKGTPVKVSERVDNSCMHLGPSGAGQLVQFDVGNVQRTGTKTGNIVSNSTSNLLDLNSSTPPASFQQPFTDLQQVQLRAQIFVYGSLIQGAAPDEACMISAFGTSDGVRSIWEPAWRSCVERFHGQKSLIVSAEVPGIQSGSGLKTPDQPSKQDLHHSKVISASAARPSSKGTSIPVITPMMPLSSPLWNMATPSCDGLPPSSTAKGAVMGYQAVSPLHPYQTPPMRNFIGQTTSWLSQTPLTASWVTPQTSAFDISTRIPVFPTTEPVNLTPVEEPSGVVSTGAKYAPPSPVAPGMLSGVLAETSLIDGEKGTAPPEFTCLTKTRKRKKTSSTEGPGQISLPTAPAEPVSAPTNNCHLSIKAPSSEDIGHVSMVARSQTETLSAPIVSSHFSTSVAVVTPNIVSKCKSNTVASSISVDHCKRVDGNLEKRKLISLDMNKIEEAKIQAEEAAKHAAAALGHCQGVWSQLDKQKNSGLMSDIETKLASAAATIAAAASVAKAAAAAAKIASSAASQARQMADEALVSSTNAPLESRTDSLPEFVRNLGSATPASILKGGDEPNGSGSIIFAAREAARRRVEAASAAARHAENLVAIVKAAELASEAVSHAGKVVTMGDPLTLSELVEAGPDGYWKVSEAHCEQGVKSNDVNVGRSDFNGVENASDVCLEKSEDPSKKAAHALTMGPSPLPEGISANTIEGSIREEEGISSSIACAEKDMRDSKVPSPNTSELTKTPDVSTKPKMDSRSTSFQEVNGNNASSTKENNIKEGCHVEVFRDSGDFNDAWFLANVLSLKDGNAFVCYTTLQSDKGSAQLKEWIPLGIDGDEVPRIRAAHPMTLLISSDGARKRRREAVKEYSWSVGDQVDAWIHDCWREGVIIEKNKKDETTFTVNFPARGDNAVVRVWHLRPRLVWKDGEWIEWFPSKEQSSFQGDTPKEKRMKLGNPASEAREKAKVKTNINMPESGTNEETKLLPLSADEKIFNVGSKMDENKPNTLRTMRSGLQKEGPKVVFGVPRPGKKRKFMDVSKHYDSNRGIKTSSTNEAAKYAKYVMPTGSGVGGWRNNSKTDPREKLIADSRSKALKSRKPPTSSKILKDNFLKSTSTTSGDATSTDHVAKDIITYEKSESGQSDSVKFGPNAEDVAEDSIHFSSEALPAEPSKKASKLKNKPEQLNKLNRAATSGKSIKDEGNDKSNSETSEPRRSNRRIQPTSRLLEGLQSSLIISKFPTVSHDRSHKSHNRGTSKGGNSHG
ncbi:PREDICTED: uncharacterized protein LOC109152804 isoform X4 [Ipomoea nil]|nr:PREDICTED: uncharacterized protein LOC109152804 isoform X4 [Ipomoea nil]XP_019156002.1 PREDICTED: uncharacterized protein LOC109152804 isoform X4 [Ipomoea nil]